MDEIVSSYPRRYTERFSPGTCEGSSVSSYVRIKRVKVDRISRKSPSKKKHHTFHAKQH